MISGPEIRQSSTTMKALCTRLDAALLRALKVGAKAQAEDMLSSSCKEEEEE